MACGACGRRRAARNKDNYDLMGNYKYLTARQLNARLEAYKRRFCTSCEKRYDCDYPIYVQCKKENK